MVFVNPLGWEEARDCVCRIVSSHIPRKTELVPIGEACGRVIARDVPADRAYPPFSRSMRDGFAVRASNLPGTLRVVGEVRAGQESKLDVGDGECVEIMTGAPVPSGADAILMVEYIERKQDFIATDRSLRPGDNISPQGSEADTGQRVIEAGTRLDYAHIGSLATVGWEDVPVYQKPTVSVIATGDEIVPLDVRPGDHQIRNSNSYSLRAQVVRAGAVVQYSTLALDTREALRAALDRAFATNLILFSGGVSAGKYDLVEHVLAEYNAEFFFTRVLIQPGQPAVFGRVRDTFFFGLPGNPASTMVTFELFARLGLELLSGEKNPQLALFQGTLSQSFCHKKGLTRFLPARLKDGTVTPVRWQGSGDIFALARANAFLVAEPDRESWEAGDLIRVLPR